MKHLYFWLLIISSSTLAQVTRPDTAFVSRAAANGKRFYQTSTRVQSQLYNGSQYIDYTPMEEEHPYFLSNDWSNGSIIYAGQLFENTPMLYDISEDKIIAEHFAGAFIELITARVTSFDIHGRKFRRYSKEDDSRRSISDGFFEVLYDGKIKILAKHVKRFNQVIEQSTIRNEFDSKDSYYLLRNNTFYPVSSKRSVLEILGDKKQELKAYIRDQKLDFKYREESLIRIAEFYDTLNP